MPEEPKTEAASIDAKLAEMEQAVNTEAGKSEESPNNAEEAGTTENTPDEGQAFNELAAKKGFKSADDLAKAYANLESQSTRVTQELRALTQEVRASRPQPVKQDPMKDMPPEQRKALELLGSIIDERLDKRLKPIVQTYEQESAHKEIEQVKTALPFVSDAHIAQAVDIVAQHPSLSLEQAVKIVAFEDAKASQAQQQSRTEKTQQKKRAFVESSQGARTGDTMDYSRLSLEELEAILPKAGQYIDYKGNLKR